MIIYFYVLSYIIIEIIIIIINTCLLQRNQKISDFFIKKNLIENIFQYFSFTIIQIIQINNGRHKNI